jgi:hypothetical protein
MGTKHKHYDVIVAWAAGEEIQCETLPGIWVSLPSHPAWDTSINFRIKPKRVKKEGWVNVYRDSFGQAKAVLLDNKVQADEFGLDGRKACIRIEWEEEA